MIGKIVRISTYSVLVVGIDNVADQFLQQLHVSIVTVTGTVVVVVDCLRIALHQFAQNLHAVLRSQFDLRTVVL